MPKIKDAFLEYLLLTIVALVFCFSLFKNISYPLVWNDESEGAMVGKRVLEFGYPKVHDGKNVVFMSLAANITDEEGNTAGYKKEYDAYVYITWGNYYWAALGTYLGSFTDNIYTKTGILRTTYTLTGFLGLLLFLLPFLKAIGRNKQVLWIMILFFFIEIFSISLALHMREARYFSLVIFCCGAFYYLYSKFFIQESWSYKKYLVWMSLFLFFTYHINFITYAILSATLAFSLLIKGIQSLLITKEKLGALFISSLKKFSPAIISLALIIPFLIFYETFKTSKIISEYSKFTFDTYKTNLGMLVKFFTELEFIYTLLIVKGLWLIIYYRFKKSKIDKNVKERISMLHSLALFSTIFFIVYGFMIARSPYLFVRHYIAMQPIMALIILIDLILIFYYMKTKWIKKQIWLVTLVIFVVSFGVNARNKLPYVKDHYFEITHQYKGVLDFIIPYIKDNFPNPEDLVIATDYEEFAYMYYLGSKVTIGYIRNNLEEDLKHQPDIIMYRKSWGGNPQIFNDFMQKEQYERIAFPVADYPVNNIPELDFSIKHLFRTKLARNEQEKAEIWVRKSLLDSLRGSVTTPSPPAN